MFFSIKCNSQMTELAKRYLPLRAKQAVLLFEHGAAEAQLNRHFIKKYNRSLVTVCLQIIKNAKIMQNDNEELIIIFMDKQHDKWASLITYGNETLPGSNILKVAFCRE